MSTINFEKYLNSTSTHYISNSGSDENKSYTGGKAGDQTGKEWQLKPWYSRPWSVVLRFPDQAVALTIAKLGIAAALNDLIGYDQAQRTTYWKQLQAAGYDPSKITVACEEDCTAGVSANVKAAGFIHGIKALQDVSICSSRNMKSVLTKAGFKALTDSKYLTGTKYLLPGDILLYENHHAATNVTCGSAVRGSWKPGTVTPSVTTLTGANESISTGANESTGESAVTVEPVTDTLTVELLGSVNIRKGPDTTYNSLGVAGVGERLRFHGFTFPNGWLLVEHRGQLAAVSGKYARVISS